ISLFLWVFKGDFNIFDNGFADLAAFFELAPWILIFLVPAVTMKCFSEEKKQGTLELLFTKPISYLQIVLGKYLGSVLLVIIAIIPTLLYVITVYQLGNPTGNLDFGSTLGAYFGLLFLILAYTSIGVFSSSLSENQIVSFIIAVVICFLFYYGFEGLSGLTSLGEMGLFITDLGMKSHFDSIGRGVIDTRDIIYFLSITAFFIVLTLFSLKKDKKNVKLVIKATLIIIGLLIINTFLYDRFDLTQDKRYTLSEAAKNTIRNMDKPIIIDVLLEGNFPSEFKKLQVETKQILEEFASVNNNVKFSFVDPLEDENSREDDINMLQQLGLTPVNVTVEESAKVSQELVFPWAMVSSGDKTVPVSLLKNKIGLTIEEKVNNSVQQLEYAFADAFTKLTLKEKKKIAVLKGNGE